MSIEIARGMSRVILASTVSSAQIGLSEAVGRRVDLRDVLQLCLEVKPREAVQIYLTVPKGMVLGWKASSLRKGGSGPVGLQCAFGVWLRVQTRSRLSQAI